MARSAYRANVTIAVKADHLLPRRWLPTEAVAPPSVEGAMVCRDKQFSYALQTKRGEPADVSRFSFFAKFQILLVEFSNADNDNVTTDVRI